MSYQDPIYIRSENSAIRNKDIFNISTSSDFCVFSAPTFVMSGTTKIPCNDLSCSFTGVSYSDILSGSTGTCNTVIVSASCIDNITWSVRVLEDNDIAYSGDFFTQDEISGTTPTNTNLLSGLTEGLDSLGYIYTSKANSVTITRPFGVDQLDIDVCLTYNQIDGCFSGTCSADCTTICTQNYDTIGSGDTGVYILSGDSGTIDITFNFIGNTSSFVDNNSIFKYEIYKFDNDSNEFGESPLFTSGDIEWSSFSATSATTQTIPLSDLNIDGDYLVKGYFNHPVCTEFRGLLGETIEGSDNKGGDKFGIYESAKDFFFIGILEANNPILEQATSSNPLGTLVVTSFLPEPDLTTISINVDSSTTFILALNGLILASTLDYTFSGTSSGNTTVTLNGVTVAGDVITYATVVGDDTDTLFTDIYEVNTAVISGVTDAEGSESIYFNTDTGKYELFTTLTPRNSNDIFVSINGVVLANNIDYYQSISNPKRIILEGSIQVGDIINIFYATNAEVAGNISENNQSIAWQIPTAPLNDDGLFTVEVANDEDMFDVVFSAQTPYVVGQTSYIVDITVSGSVGTTLYYSVKNEKRYESIKGDVILSEAFSEIVPITIQTNSINSY